MKTVQELMNLSGQVAIVTGGAAGIGVQMAYALGEAGADIVIAARKLNRCLEAAASMEKDLGVKVMAAGLDVTVPEEIDALYDLVLKNFGRVDILVNNSGATWGAPSLEFPLEGWDKVIRTNLTGSWLMAQRAAGIMSRQNYGRIINIASLGGLIGMEPNIMDAVSYQASKAAIIGLTRDLAVKWARYNITVNALAPGFFPTKMTKGTLDRAGDDFLRMVPMKRYGGEDDLKAAILFLASPGAAYCTGVTIPIDGGVYAG